MQTPSPYKLQVAPLPSHRSDVPEAHSPIPDGFVDDEVIATLIARPQTAARLGSSPSDLVLSSDENDFAGWAIRSNSPFRVIAEKQEMVVSRPLPAESEPGIGQPHRGSHRWWIAAVTSAASALLFSFLFSSFADQPGGIGFLSRANGVLQSALGSLIP